MGKEDPVLVDMLRLNQQQAAGLIGVTSRTLRDWPDAPRNDDGSYDGPALVKWRIEKQAHPTGLVLDDERARLAKEQADRLGIENAIRRGGIADLSVVGQVLSSAFGAFRARMLAIPSKLAPKVNPGNPNLARDVIQLELCTTLDELSAIDVRGIVIERAAVSAGPAPDTALPAEIDGERVGRPRAKAQPRKQRRTGKMGDK